MYIAIEPLRINAQMTHFLSMCGLPIADLSPSAPLRFFAQRAGSELVGVVGLELYPPHALLRSLAVSPAHRNQGLGRALVAFAETQATAQGVTALFLLTTSAAPFFSRVGYQPVARTTAPPAIQATAQFSGLCPSSSSFMIKQLV